MPRIITQSDAFRSADASEIVAAAESDFIACGRDAAPPPRGVMAGDAYAMIGANETLTALIHAAALASIARAAAMAVAAKYLGVAAPERIGIAGEGPEADLCAATHRWVFPDARLRLAQSGERACACDIVSIPHGSTSEVASRWLADGTHLGMASSQSAPSVHARISVIDDSGLARITAGTAPGRQGVELSAYACGPAPSTLDVVASALLLRAAANGIGNQVSL